MKPNELYFCAILHFRYLNPKLMGPAHDFVEQNAPKEMPKGFVSSRSLWSVLKSVLPFNFYLLTLNNAKNKDINFLRLKG